MAGSSNAPLGASARIQDFEYLYASNTNVSNFVSVKLSGNRNYLLWKAQMICLMDTHNMIGIVDATYVGPRDSGPEIMRQYYDRLLKGWIFGSVGEDVLVEVFNLASAKEVWEKLKSIYDPATSLQQDSALTKPEAKTDSKDTDSVSVETTIHGEDTISIEIIGEILSSEIEENGADVENKTEVEDTEKKFEKMFLRKATMLGNWPRAESIIKYNEDLARKAISSDGSTVLHIAVGTGHNDFVKKLFSYLNDEEVLEQRTSDGSTALHIAAIVGNKYAADLLVKKNNKLLRIEDHKGKKPLHKAYENMHLDTIGYLLKDSNDDDGKSKLHSFSLGDSAHPHLQLGVNIGVDLLVNSISAKQYNLALELIENFPKFASKSDDVLMALAKTFPSGLDSWETHIYQSLDNTLEQICTDVNEFLFVITLALMDLLCGENLVTVLLLPLWMVIEFTLLVINIVSFSFLVTYFLLWKGAKILGGPIKHIEKKKKEWSEATKVLELVCTEIDKLKYSGTHHPYYTRPILEAACQNAYKVVDEILYRSPEAIQSTNKSGYDIIQLAVIHRSEKIYNLIYDFGERKNLYRTKVDSSKNNILHLAGCLAPSNELNRRTGAALQLQRELQWREEVKKLVFPTYITKENIFKETPDMVFTREHENLVKEGEKWMKTTAESCSITAALITTIVFAAAITVPGGSNQETGTPLFKKDIAFTIFAISDAISLFASSTALLVFLSILTARFAEKDFLVSLPRRLLIGLFSLLLSTTAMMVAFSATLFLVFCDKKPWMIAPICALAFIPVAFFVTLQFPLIIDLFCSTHLRIFGKQRKSVIRRFNPDDIRLFFGK